MRHLFTLCLFLVACGDDANIGGADLFGDGGDAADSGDGGSTPPPCQVALTEIGEGFAEVLVDGACAQVALTIRDAALDGCAVTSDHAVPAGPGRHVINATIPTGAVLTLEGNGRSAVIAFGSCPPPEACLVERTAGAPICAPAREAPGSVSLCEETWLAGRVPTPGAPNDCVCSTDCGAAAPACNAGACIDGRCVFTAVTDGAPCTDNNLCTSNESCVAGVCRGELRECPDPGPCASAPSCDPKTGRCEAVEACGEDAECTATGCECLDGFAGDGVTCNDIDECAASAAPCPEGARCVNAEGGFACLCPPGQVLEGGVCAVSPCACPWDDSAARTGGCAAERGRLRLAVYDLWGGALTGAALTVTRRYPDGSELAVAAATDAARETTLDLPVCAATTLHVVAEARDHHRAEVTVRWDGQRAEVVGAATRDAAWVLAEDRDGPRVALGLAHRWFAASGPPPRGGNRLELLMDHANAWAALHADLSVTNESVTGTSWWWESDHELLRDGSRPALSEAARWPDTILGVLEALEGVERRILINQFVSQDGFFSDYSVDDALLAFAEAPLDDFEYMGQANPASGRFTVTPAPVDLRARLAATGRFPGDVAGEAARPFSAPIPVDLTALPLGLSVFDLPIASWHQKFWTLDNAIAYVGGMNAQKAEWDGSEHIVFDPRRMEFDARTSGRMAVAQRERLPDFEPYKDYMLRIDGPLVADAVALFHRRWESQRAAGVRYADRATAPTLTPQHATHSGGVRAQLVATMPGPAGEWSILETLLRAVSEARDYILIEDQYFRAPLLYDAIVARMRAVPGLRLIAVTNAVSEWTNPGCWQTALAHERFASLFPSRFRIFRLRAFDVVRSDCFFCIDETDAYFEDIIIHSKVVLIDDVYLEVGSCNSNNRGLLYEGELAVAVHDPTWVRAQRARIVENMLGPGYNGNMPTSQLIMAFDEAAAWNGRAYDAWDADGMDLDLDGDPIPAHMVPSGFVYPLRIRAPNLCLIEGVGPDIM